MEATALSTRMQKRLASRVSLLALTTLISTIALILMGSIVRVTGHGLGCPDWPLCYGQPIPPFLVGAWMEFTHRLIGLIASVQIVALGWIGLRRYRYHAWLKGSGIALLVLLAIQIPLGGLHVILEIPPETGLIHTAIALAIVGLVALMFALLHPATVALRKQATTFMQDRRFLRWLTVGTVLLYLLLLTGSLVTRLGASLACPSWPFCGVPREEWSTLVWIQVLHRYTAYATGGLLLVLAAYVLRRAPSVGWRRFAYGLFLVLLAQFTLGVLNVLLRIPMTTRALHLTVGSTLWVLVVILWVVVHPGIPDVVQDNEA